MKTWMLTLLALAPLALAGCRVDPAIPILERELFRKDQEIYQLRGTVDDLHDSVLSLERRLARRGEGAGDEGASSQGNHSGGVAAPTFELPDKGSSKPPASLTNPGGPSVDVPDVPKELEERSGPVPPSNSTPPSDQRPAAPLHRTSGARADGLESSVPIVPNGQSRRVAGVALLGGLTGAAVVDGQSNLWIVVEPRDASGNGIDAPAQVGIVVRDRALRGQASELLYREFTARETVDLFRRIGSTRALCLPLPWSGDMTKHTNLEVHVRYVTADGRELKAREPIDVAPAADRTAQWRPIETSGTANPPTEREPIREARRSEWSATTPEATAERPVWSPERR